MTTANASNIESSPLSVSKIRTLIIIGTGLLAAFMFADLALLPESLKQLYIQSRFSMQFPLCALFLIASFHPSFLKHYQKVLCLLMLSIVYINYWVILTAWQLEQFPFPYEGTVMYSLFTLFVFRLNFKYSLFFAALVITGFALIVVNYPIYGMQTGVNFGFVLIGLIVGLIGVHQVENALRKLSNANSDLATLSQKDHLTDINNRRTYETRFSEQLSLNKRDGNTICLFIIDLDYFKDYNDGYGHAQGDDVIKLQAQQLKSIFRRDSDIVARYGGEEFVVVAAKMTHDKCVEFANRILDQWTLAKVPHGKGKACEYVTCSIGFYLERITKNTDQHIMFSYADKALYQAKAKGRNCFVEFKLDEETP